MQYDPELQNHNLPHNPFKALISPRPIAWISSTSTTNILNLAPYSFFNAFCDTPPIIGFGATKGKDSQRNIEETKEFVCNIASYDMRHKISDTSAPVASDVSEFELANLDHVPSQKVSVPRVKGIPAAFECVYLKTITLESYDNKATEYDLILGQVVSIYIDDQYITDTGLVDVTKYRPLSRLGYKDYASVDSVFEITRPIK